MIPIQYVPRAFPKLRTRHRSKPYPAGLPSEMRSMMMVVVVVRVLLGEVLWYWGLVLVLVRAKLVGSF